LYNLHNDLMTVAYFQIFGFNFHILASIAEEFASFHFQGVTKLFDNFFISQRSWTNESIVEIRSYVRQRQPNDVGFSMSIFKNKMADH